MKGWTYGAEHELGDWIQDALPIGMKMDRRDVTVMNSNGIAADPLGRSYNWGGEINTVPSDDIEGQLDQLDEINRISYYRPTINHRSNLHLHIRVPGLRESLPQLKRLADFAWHVAPRVLPLIEPLPRPDKRTAQSDDGYKGECRRWRRRRVSHQTVLTEQRHAWRMTADTVDQFFARHAPHKDGRPQHHLQPREAVNLRQLTETDTIEFRHFPGTLDREQLRKAFEWCRMFTEAALWGTDDLELHVVREAAVFGQIIPWPEYVHWKEVRYRATCHDGTMKRDEIERNIARILNGEFDDHPV